MKRRILICSLQVGQGASKGHLNPLIGLVQWLVRSGAEVGWLPLPSSMGEADRRQVEAQGVRVLDTPPLPDGVIKPDHELARLAMDPTRVWEVYRSFLIDPLEHLVEPARAVIRAFAPHAAACDGMSYSGILACALEGVPWAGIGAGLKILKDGGFAGAYMGDLQPLIAPRAHAFASANVAAEFRLFECVSPHANVVYTTRALVGDLPLPERTHLVGPATPPAPRGDESAFPWERLDGRPLVYVAFGSVHTKLVLETLNDAIGRAAAALDVQLVVSSEALSERALPPGWPADALILRYVPQPALLARAAAFVTHGGANSVMEGLACGVPLLVVPLSSDQPWQAELVTRAGVGESMTRAEATPERVAAALARLIAPDGELRKRARAVAESYAKADGAREAARRVLELAQQAGG